MIPKPIIHEADCQAWMQAYDGPPFDSVITDPPYSLQGGFMGKAWDNLGDWGYLGFSADWLGALRGCVKPGAHAAVFGAPRTFDLQAVGARLAGWEVRDTLMWLYGSGFPKSHNLAGDETLPRAPTPRQRCKCGGYVPKGKLYGAGAGDAETRCANCGADPPLPTGKNGWGTALKPAWEPILLLRAPLAGTTQANFDAHGVGAMNINAARVPLKGPTRGMEDARGKPCKCESRQHNRGLLGFSGLCDSCGGFPSNTASDAGRWPANLALDEEAAAVLDADAQSWPNHLHYRVPTEENWESFTFTIGGTTTRDVAKANARADLEGDDTRPSRFFYVSKASTAEREEGLRGFAPQRRTDGRESESEHPRLRTSKRRNVHPTVKPIELGRWLTRLLAPPGGRVLDPFAGSGSFGIAAYQEGAEWVGLEREAEYVEIARARIAHWCAQGRMI